MPATLQDNFRNFMFRKDFQAQRMPRIGFPLRMELR